MSPVSLVEAPLTGLAWALDHSRPGGFLGLQYPSLKCACVMDISTYTKVRVQKCTRYKVCIVNERKQKFVCKSVSETST